MSIKKITYSILLFFLIQFSNLLVAQDDLTPPPGFEYNQSMYQSFFFLETADIDDASLQEGDWIGSFNGDICVGAWPWQGQFTQLPAMGDDGTQWTEDYLLEGQFPSFKIYDSSANIIYVATPSDNHAFVQFGTWVLSSISVIDDCNGDLGGLAYFDDCSDCSGGNSGHIENAAQDCQGICDGLAYVNGCGDCVTSDTDTCNVDCNQNLVPDDCSDLLTPGCASFDDCGVCSLGSTGLEPNADADCLGVCFGSAALMN